MKKWVIASVVLAALVVVSCGLLHVAGRAGHRARFILAVNALRAAQADLEMYGAFTNRMPGDTVYPYTNRFVIDATVYQCGLAVESVDLYFRDRGILAMTTNAVLVWVDHTHGAVPLGTGTAFAFPPGL